MKIMIAFFANIVSTIGGLAFIAGLIDMAISHYSEKPEMFASTDFLWASAIAFVVGIAITIIMLFSTILSGK